MLYAPYSFSKIYTFFECQKKFEFTYVNKIPVDTEYVDPTYFKRGRFLHAFMANVLSGGDGTNIKNYDITVNDKLYLVDCANNALEHEYISFSYTFDINKIEHYISFNKNLDPAGKNEEQVLKGYIDYFAIKDTYAIIVDWKTGKYKNKSNYFQLELYAMWIFSKYPQVTEIDLVFYYVESDKISLKIVNAAHINTFKATLQKNINIIENTTEFKTNESKLCKHCQFLNTCIEKYKIIYS